MKERERIQKRCSLDTTGFCGGGGGVQIALKKNKEDIIMPPFKKQRKDEEEEEEFTMREKLECLDVDMDQLANAKKRGGLDEEFKTIKKSYHRECLKKHPDKGGSEETFVTLTDVWENVREMYERKSIESYWEEAQHQVKVRRRRRRTTTTTTTFARTRRTTTKAKNKTSSYRPYKFYEEAAAYDDPEYRVELARSNRSSCVATAGGLACEHVDVKIEKDEIRCGHRNPTSGSFGNWSHLRCWRVPKRVWLGLPDARLGPLEKRERKKKKRDEEEEIKKTKTTTKRRGRKATNAKGRAQPSMDRRVALIEEEEEGEFTLTEEQFAAYNDAISRMNEDLLEGFVQLSDGDQRAFVLHCANRKNWAIPSGSKTGEGFDLALLPFEGAKNKGAWGMTHRSEVAIVPGAKEVKKRIANLESQAAAVKKKKTATAAARNRTTRTKNKQMVKREVKQFYEEDLEAQSNLLDALFEETFALKAKEKKSTGAKRKAPLPPAPAAARKKKNNNKNNKNAQEEEEEEDTKVAIAGNQQHLVPLNKMEPMVTVPATAKALSGKKFVMTGIFPELGGGVGLNLGKDKARELIETFGGRVVGGVSGATTHLLVGTEPGASKVEKARGRNMTLVNVQDLQKCLNLGDQAARDQLGQEKVIIEAFSGGFYGNSKAYDMSEEKLQVLAGLKDAPRLEDALPASSVPKPKPKPKKGRRVFSLGWWGRK